MAQPVRHLLEYLGLPYDDVHLPSDNPNNWFRGGFEEIRKRCLFPNLPYLEDSNFVVSEPIAMCKYLCRKAGRDDLLGNSI
jgi:glutathione S-transferase